MIARTDADAADLVTSDVDENDKPFLTGERTSEGFYRSEAGLEQAISRGLAYAPYSDLVWCETSKPDLEQAKTFAEAIKKDHPEIMLAYNCSPSFMKQLFQNSKKNLVPWGINFNLLLWQAYILCGTACLVFQKSTLPTVCQHT